MSEHAGRLAEVFERLHREYGPQHWWPGETPFEVIVGAILTQSAAWTNVEKAIANLKAVGALSPGGIHRLDEGELAALIRPSGYFNAKARKLKAFVEMLYERFGGDLGALLAVPAPHLRDLLLSTHGIGPETADSIVLYAAGQPAFVIDAYTRRIFGRLGFDSGRDRYDDWRSLFTSALPSDPALFNEYHALIVRLGKDRCRRSRPLCERCPLREGCPVGQEVEGGRWQEQHSIKATKQG